jgi:alkanesulfonate monooxygenase
VARTREYSTPLPVIPIEKVDISLIRRPTIMPVEFLGIAATSNGSEIQPREGAAFDKEYTLRLARAHEENGWDRVLFAYGSGAPDPNIGAAYIASKTETLQLLLAHRPNVAYPTFAAKTFATVDQVSGGRATVHFITGGTDHEQQREGDYLSKDERYERTREYMAIVKQAWTSREPFDHDGRHYKFADFVSDVFPVQQPRPRVSFGGSSPAAYRAGGAEADIYCLWGEPLASTAEQIEWVKQAAKEAGRTDVPKIQVAFRPIIAPTEAGAWEKAHDIVDRIEARVAAGGGALSRRRPIGNPENTGSQRLMAIAEEGERFDRALWTRTAAATGGAGNSNALVGTPETVAAAILDYIDLGVDIISMRGYDLLADAVEVGQQVIPIVREEVAKRDAAAA